MRKIHDSLSTFTHSRPLLRFREIVTQHIISRTIFDGQLVSSNVIGNKEVSDFDVSSILRARLFPVSGKSHGTLFVLIHYVINDIVSLAFDKMPDP